MASVYEIVTEKIVKLLDEGVVPWQKPWHSGIAPRNTDGRKYRGVNAFLLGVQPYADPRWTTFNNCRDLKGCVRSGSKGTQVVFWKSWKVGGEDEELSEKTIPLLRYYTVFNVEQTTLVKDGALPAHEEPWLAESPIIVAEGVIANMPNPPGIDLTGHSAYYAPTVDAVVVPPMGRFDRPDDFYSTLFHELAHSTGHEKRLNRQDSSMRRNFSSEAYGREELVAEFAAAFVCNEIGIDRTVDNPASYIANWRQAIVGDPKAVVMAASRAQKAADYIQGRYVPKTKEEAR